jgi:hypothetical protein
VLLGWAESAVLFLKRTLQKLMRLADEVFAKIAATKPQPLTTHE